MNECMPITVVYLCGKMQLAELNAIILLQHTLTTIRKIKTYTMFYKQGTNTN